MLSRLSYILEPILSPFFLVLREQVVSPIADYIYDVTKYISTSPERLRKGYREIDGSWAVRNRNENLATATTMNGETHINLLNRSRNKMQKKVSNTSLNSSANFTRQQNACVTRIVPLIRMCRPRPCIHLHKFPSLHELM